MAATGLLRPISVGIAWPSSVGISLWRITKLNETYLRKLKFDGSSIKSFVVHRVNMRDAHAPP